MSYIPSLQPRGVDARPRRIGLARAFQACITWGVIPFVIKVLDWFGKGEAAMDIYKLLPHALQFLGSSAFSGLAIAGGFVGLIWQGKRQQVAPESIPVRQIVHPDSKLPVFSKRPLWPTIRRPVVACVIAVAIAVPIWACYQTPLRSFLFPQKISESQQSRDVASLTEPNAQQGPAAEHPSNHPQRSEPKGKKGKGAPIPPSSSEKPTQSRSSQSELVNIPVPDQRVATRRTSERPAVKFVASIDGQAVQASSKAPGTLIVSLAMTSNSQYLGSVTSTDLSNVAEALKKTGKITLFMNKSAGSYQIRGNDLGYSLSITQIHPRTIYYFDTKLDGACAALKTIISGIVGQMDCKYVSIQASSDPSQPNVAYEFVTQSGLDMEVDL